MKRFEVYLVTLDPTVGVGIQKTRPCVIISPDEMNDYLQMVIVAPMTTVVEWQVHARVVTQKCPGDCQGT